MLEGGFHMRRTALLLAIGIVAGLSAPAFAQSGATRSVDDYLCTFAGKCGEDAKEAVADDESIAAPDTKGMSLARRRAPAASSTAATPSRPTATTSRGATPSRATASNARTPSRSAGSASRTAARAPQGKRLDLRLTFMLNSAELTPQAKEEAKVFARSLLLPELAGKRFLIEGHTDSSGSRSHNMLLSARRAAAVADYLSSLGVPRNRLEVRGFGPDRPIGGRASSPENRRVEAVLL